MISQSENGGSDQWNREIALLVFNLGSVLLIESMDSAVVEPRDVLGDTVTVYRGLRFDLAT